MGSEQAIRVRDKRKAEWFSIDNRIIDDFAREMGPHATLVYVALCRHGNAEPEVIIYLRTLGDELGMGMTTVRKAIHRLERFDLVHVIEYIEPTGQKPNEYLLRKVPTGPRADWETREPPTRTRHDRPPSRGDGPDSQGPSRGDGGPEPPSSGEGGASRDGGPPAPDAGPPARGEGLTKEEEKPGRTTLQEEGISRVDRIEGAIARLPVSPLDDLVAGGLLPAEDVVFMRTDWLGRQRLKLLGRT